MTDEVAGLPENRLLSSKADIADAHSNMTAHTADMHIKLCSGRPWVLAQLAAAGKQEAQLPFHSATLTFHRMLLPCPAYAIMSRNACIL